MQIVFQRISSRWALRRRRCSHRETGPVDGPRTGGGACIVRGFPAPLRGAAGLTGSYRWEFAPPGELPPANLFDPFGIGDPWALFQETFEMTNHEDTTEQGTPTGFGPTWSVEAFQKQIHNTFKKKMLRNMVSDRWDGYPAALAINMSLTG